MIKGAHFIFSLHHMEFGFFQTTGMLLMSNILNEISTITFFSSILE